MFTLKTLFLPTLITGVSLVALAQALPSEESNVIVIGINLLTGVLGVPIITWIKERLGLKNGWAYLLAAFVATVLAIGQLLLTNTLDLSNVVFDNFYEVFTSVFFVSNALYRAMTEYTKAGGLG